MTIEEFIEAQKLIDECLEGSPVLESLCATTGLSEGASHQIDSLPVKSPESIRSLRLVVEQELNAKIERLNDLGVDTTLDELGKYCPYYSGQGPRPEPELQPVQRRPEH
jgi:hypothetical protein